jgi:hypothetical protein
MESMITIKQQALDEINAEDRRKAVDELKHKIRSQNRLWYWILEKLPFTITWKSK